MYLCNTNDLFNYIYENSTDELSIFGKKHSVYN
jgi:hypothetical protein